MQKIKNNVIDIPLALNAEIADLLYGSNSRALLAAAIVAAALVVVQHDYIAPVNLLIWLASFMFAYSLRSVLVAKYYKSHPINQDVNKWLSRFRFCSCLCGLSWGMAGVLLFPEFDFPHQAFLIFALVGIAGGGVIVYSIDILCSNLFIGGLLIPTTSQLIISGSEFTIATAILFTVFTIYITVAGRVMAKSLRDNIQLRISAGHDNERVHKLAHYDVLTNLPNRRLLSHHLHQTFIDSQQSQSYGALLFLDLDDFKNINDLRGHNAGDQLLQQVAERLQQSLQDRAFVARVGGDEFVIVMSDIGQDNQEAHALSQAFSEDMMQVIGKPFQLDGFNYHSTPSIGICVFFGDEYDEVEVLRRADIAMYQAKRLGRKNTLQFYDESQNPALQLRAAMENDLRVALQDQQFSLLYQLQVDQDQNQLGAEILLRWNHPALGFVSPDDFIPIAEETGEIISIGSWVLMQACTQLKLWEKDPAKEHLKLSVNVSALQFNQPDFTDNLINYIQSSGCNPSLLKIELTESLILQNIGNVINKMQRLKEEGISFSLDDFGTGHSSLSVLKRLPIDELKIDQSFVGDLEENSDDQFIAQTIISMGKNLGLNVIAEGVETEGQKNLLHQYGCHTYQGYLFGKPLPLEAFEASLKK